MQKNHTTVLMIAAALGADRLTDEFFNDHGTEADAIEVLKLCLERGVDLRAFNDNGDTALHRAVGGDIIRFLVERGADVHVTNKQGQTPLEAALARRDRNGAIRFPAAVAALKELTEPTAGTHQASPNTRNP
jgi:ankyrin repeat protein